MHIQVRSPIRSIELKLTTPAVAGGWTPTRIDPVTPLRPASIRGGLRWWFRAAASYHLRPSSADPKEQKAMLAALRKQESNLFGSTEFASAIVLIPGPTPEVGWLAADRHRQAGLRYLGYGLFEKGNPETLEPEKPLSFRLRFRDPRDQAKNEEMLAATLWLWAHLGGLGARSRRGFGSMVLTNLGGLPWDGPGLMTSPPADENALVRHLARGIGHALEVFGRHLPAPGANDDPHPAIRSLAGLRSLRALPTTWPTALLALDQAGQLFQQFRSTLARSARGQAPLPDYHEVKAALQGQPGAPRSVERAAFGLPLPFYFRSLNGAKGTVELAAEGDENSGPDRLASPLIFRVFPVANGRFAVVLAHLAESRGSDLSLGRKLVLRDRQTGQALPVALRPSETIIRDFVAWAMQKVGGRR